MKEKNCNIVKDLLPLYIDDIVSDDTKELVEEHLKNCNECRKEKESMEEKISIPLDNDEKHLRNFKKIFRNKKIIVSLISIILTFSIFFAAFFLLFNFEIYTPYSSDLLSIETMDEDILGIRPNKDDFYMVFASSVNLDIDGMEKNIVFIYYATTIYEKHIDGLFKNELNINKESNKQGYIFPLEKREDIDFVYYLSEPIKNTENINWKEKMEQGTLIWENK